MALGGLVVLASCDGLDCGFGGPGCGTPGLLVCNVPVAPGQRVQALATYFDDTGRHPATVNSVSTTTPALLAVELGGSVGQLTVTTLDAGVGLITVDVAGWKGKTFTWSLDTTGADVVFDAGQPPPQFAGQADGGLCAARALSLAK